MYTFQIERVVPIGRTCEEPFGGIASDDCYFYLTAPNRCEIDQYNKEFCKIRQFRVTRPYTSLCYDRQWKCFWALARGRENRIFQLDQSFCETGEIIVSGEGCTPLCITGLSCGRERNTLLIAAGTIIATVKKGCGTICSLLHKGCLQYGSVQTLQAGYVASYSKGCQSGLSLYSDCGQLESSCFLPDEYVTEDMTLGNRSRDQQTIYLLATKRCQRSCILECSLSCQRQGPCDSGGIFPCYVQPRPRLGCWLGGVL